MKNLKQNSIEWLEFARSIGATHWHTKGHFYKINSGHLPVIYTQNGWAPSFYDPELLNDRDIFFKIDFSQLGNKPSEPDWSKAPEGANLFWTNKWSNYPWFKEEGGKLYNFDSQTLSWVDTKGPGFMPNEFIKRPTVNQQLTVPVVNQEFTTEKVASSKMEPTTWDGTGLPPVGTVCEANRPGKWLECRIENHLNEGSNIDVIYSYDNGTRWEYSGSIGHFRPIKSERERWIDDAIVKIKKYSAVNKVGQVRLDEFLGLIYDAGLAKLPD